MEIQSPSGCPIFEATAFVKLLSNHPWVLGLLLIVFGAVTTFLGRKFFKWTIGILGGTLLFLFIMIVFSSLGMTEALDQSSEAKDIALVIIAFVLSIGLSVFVGWFLYHKAFLYGIMAVGGIAGFFGGTAIYNAFFVHLS